jgi:hypothetical protein
MSMEEQYTTYEIQIPWTDKYVPISIGIPKDNRLKIILQSPHFIFGNLFGQNNIFIDRSTNDYFYKSNEDQPVNNIGPGLKTFLVSVKQMARACQLKIWR